MIVRLVDVLTKPNRTPEICTFFERWVFPLAQKHPGFREGMCLLLRPEPRIMVVFMRWESEADADEFWHQVFPSVESLVLPLVDQMTVRGFDVGEMAAAARAA